MFVVCRLSFVGCRYVLFVFVGCGSLVVGRCSWCVVVGCLLAVVCYLVCVGLLCSVLVCVDCCPLSVVCGLLYAV